ELNRVLSENDVTPFAGRKRNHGPLQEHSLIRTAGKDDVTRRCPPTSKRLSTPVQAAHSARADVQAEGHRRPSRCIASSTRSSSPSVSFAERIADDARWGASIGGPALTPAATALAPGSARSPAI